MALLFTDIYRVLVSSQGLFWYARLSQMIHSAFMARNIWRLALGDVVYVLSTLCLAGLVVRQLGASAPMWGRIANRA